MIHGVRFPHYQATSSLNDDGFPSLAPSRLAPFLFLERSARTFPSDIDKPLQRRAKRTPPPLPSPSCRIRRPWFVTCGKTRYVPSPVISGSLRTAALIIHWYDDDASLMCHRGVPPAPADRPWTVQYHVAPAYTVTVLYCPAALGPVYCTVL